MYTLSPVIRVYTPLFFPNDILHIHSLELWARLHARLRNGCRVRDEGWSHRGGLICYLSYLRNILNILTPLPNDVVLIEVVGPPPPSPSPSPLHCPQLPSEKPKRLPEIPPSRSFCPFMPLPLPSPHLFLWEGGPLKLKLCTFPARFSSPAFGITSVLCCAWPAVFMSVPAEEERFMVIMMMTVGERKGILGRKEIFFYFMLRYMHRR